MDKGWNSMFWMKPRQQIIMCALSLMESFSQRVLEISGSSAVGPDRTLPGCLRGLSLASYKLWEDMGKQGRLWSLAWVQSGLLLGLRYWQILLSSGKVIGVIQPELVRTLWILLEPLCAIHLGFWHWSAGLSNGSVSQSYWPPCLRLHAVHYVFLVSCISSHWGDSEPLRNPLSPLSLTAFKH